MDVVECFVSIVGVFESMSRVLKFSLNLQLWKCFYSRSFSKCIENSDLLWILGVWNTDA